MAKSPFLYRKVAGSDAVVNIGYDPVTGILRVEFDHGGTYEYYDVDVGTAAGFATAGSKGQYFNQEIKGVYEYRKIG